MIDINGPNIPILGQKPQVRIVRMEVDDFILNDEQGSATLVPADDMTPVEGYRLQLMLLWCCMQPQGIVGDPLTGGKTPMQVLTLWRDYIHAHKLERHFTFSRHRTDGPIEGRS